MGIDVLPFSWSPKAAREEFVVKATSNPREFKSVWIGEYLTYHMFLEALRFNIGQQCKPKKAGHNHVGYLPRARCVCRRHHDRVGHE
jgi:hypothetical protein